jgi:hypothetical protein
MKTLAMRLLLMLSFLVSALAQDISTPPLQYNLTGREWKVLPNESRVFLVAGYLAGWSDAKVEYSCPLMDRPDDWVACVGRLEKEPNLTNGEWMAGLDHFYANPQNESVGFWLALKWVRAKAKGLPAERLEELEKSVRELSRHMSKP